MGTGKTRSRLDLPFSLVSTPPHTLTPPPFLWTPHPASTLYHAHEHRSASPGRVYSEWGGAGGFSSISRYLNYPVGERNLLPQEDDEADEQDGAAVREVARRQRSHYLRVRVFSVPVPFGGWRQGVKSTKTIIKTTTTDTPTAIAAKINVGPMVCSCCCCEGG